MRDESAKGEGAIIRYAHALESLFADSPDAVLLVHRLGRIVAASPAARQAFRLRDAGAHWDSLWSADAGASLAEAEEGRINHFRATGAAGGVFDVVLSPAPPGHALCVARTISSTHEALESQEIIVQELRHRLRNSYAISAAIASASGREAPAHKDFASSLAQRFSTLSVVQSAMGEGGAGRKLDALVAALIQAYDPGGRRIAVSPVPPVALGEQQARLVGLALGEWCTNSLRHGALGGIGEITLTVTHREGTLMLRWEEELAVAVDLAASRGGSGYGLLRRMAEVYRGAFTADFEAERLRTTLSVPYDG